MKKLLLAVFLLVLCFVLSAFGNNKKTKEPTYLYDEVLKASNYDVVEYNYPPGARELNLFGLKNVGQYNLNAVAAPDFEIMSYSEVYFHPAARVTASAIYLIPLDKSLSHKDAMLSISTKDKLQNPIMQTDFSRIEPFKFDTFTTVDWNNTSDKLLFKERLGMNYKELYLTRLYLYDLSNEKLYDLNVVREKIVDYWQEQGVDLNGYKWDITPLGFELKSDKEKKVKNIDNVLVAAYGYHQDKRKFLGIWQVDIHGENASLYSKDNEKPQVFSNGYCLKFLRDMSDIIKKQKKLDKKKGTYIEPFEPKD